MWDDWTTSAAATQRSRYVHLGAHVVSAVAGPNEACFTKYLLSTAQTKLQQTSRWCRNAFTVCWQGCCCAVVLQGLIDSCAAHNALFNHRSVLSIKQ
jgi:hypothetical protein